MTIYQDYLKVLRAFAYFTFPSFFSIFCLALFCSLSLSFLRARLSHRNSVCPSVTRVDQPKTVQDRITKSLPLAAWKTLVLGTMKLFHKFKGVHPEQSAE